LLFVLGFENDLDFPVWKSYASGKRGPHDVSGWIPRGFFLPKNLAYLILIKKPGNAGTAN
jgi:hypothetical protein